MTMTAKQEISLAREIGYYKDNPLGFVKFIFRWGKGELEGYDGPDEWQTQFLKDLGTQIKQNNFNGIDPVDPVQMATSSGHGIGKSALTSWLILFIMSTRPHCKGVVTATTNTQLRTKTWSELQKWNKRSLNSDWFEVRSGQQMKIVHKKYPETWRTDAQTCAKENSEAFAGNHSAQSTPFYIFDEASGVPNAIWDVSEGGMTDGEPMWFCFGNPTQPSGKFFECFNRQKHRWITNQIDSRSSKMTNKKKIQEWIEDFGENSDFVRVRVRGLFPLGGNLNFIPHDKIQACLSFEAEDPEGLPKTLTCDVARFGDDQTVISFKHGRKIYPMDKYRNLSTMETADKVIEAILKHDPETIFIDGGGVGGGVVDRLKQLRYDNVVDTQFGAKARNEKKYANKRAEMYGNAREAIITGLDFPDDNELVDELGGVEYGFTPKQQILLEKKSDMKKRGLSSPDCADALVMHFAEILGPRRPKAPPATPPKKRSMRNPR